MNSEMHLGAVIEGVWKCIWRPRSSERRDALGDQHRASLEMHLETKRSSELRDALGGRDWPSLVMHLEAEIE